MAPPPSTAADHTPLADLEPQPPRRRARPLRRAAALIVVATVAVACLALVGGGRPFPKPPRVVLAEAEGRTTGSGTATGRGTVTLTLGADTRQIVDMESRLDFGAKSSSVDLTAGPVHESVRSVGGTWYLSQPLVPLRGGAHWISFSPGDLRLDAAAARAIGSADPSSGLAFMNAVSGDPRVVGRESLDGVGVTHYAFDVDLKDFIDRMSQFGRDQKLSFLGDLAELGSLVDLSKLPGEAWIDRAGRVHRFELRITISAAGETASAVIDTSFSNFGEPVHVDAPPPSDTIAFRDDPTFFSDLDAAVGARAGSSG